MGRVNHINKEVIVNHIYEVINKDREVSIPKKLIAEIVKSQSDFTLDKIHSGSFETIIWKGMGKFAPNFKKISTADKKRGQ
jgi:hypothetical protein